MPRTVNIVLATIMLLALSLSVAFAGTGQMTPGELPGEVSDLGEGRYVISPELQQIMEEMNDEEKVHVCLILKSIDSEAVEEAAL